MRDKIIKAWLQFVCNGSDNMDCESKNNKQSYIEKASVGTIVAFRSESGKVKSAKIVNRSIKNKKLKLETSYGKEFIVSFNDVVWVRTGERWPRGVYNLLKGN